MPSRAGTLAAALCSCTITPKSSTAMRGSIDEYGLPDAPISVPARTNVHAERTTLGGTTVRAKQPDALAKHVICKTLGPQQLFLGCMAAICKCHLLHMRQCGRACALQQPEFVIAVATAAPHVLPS